MNPTTPRTNTTHAIMQTSVSSRCRSASAWRTSLPSHPQLTPSRRYPQQPRPKPGSTCAPDRVYNNIVPKSPSSPAAHSVLTQRCRTATLAPPPATPIFLETLYKVLTDQAVDLSSTPSPAPTDRSVLAQRKINLLSTELRESQAELASRQAALEAKERQLELLRVNLDCYKYTMADTYNRLRDRDQLAVSLQLRLQKQRTNPQYLDLETDPLIERDAVAIVKDKYVTKLHQENLDLLQRMHELEQQVDA